MYYYMCVYVCALYVYIWHTLTHTSNHDKIRMHNTSSIFFKNKSEIGYKFSLPISNSNFFTHNPILAHDNTNTKAREKKTRKQKPSAPPDSGTKIAFWRGAGHLGRCEFWDGAAVFCPVIPAYIFMYVDTCMLCLHVHMHIGGGRLDSYRCWDCTAVPLPVIPTYIFMYAHIYTLYTYAYRRVASG